MKNLLITLSLFVTTSLFSQTITNPTGPKVVTDTTKSVNYDIDKFSSEYAQVMSTWPKEKLDWFNQTFCYKRGHITIPEKPIQPYVKQD